MITADAATGTERRPDHWKTVVRKYQQPSLRLAVWQLVNSVGAYVAVWALISWSLPRSGWLTAALTILGGGLLVRIFIIFHDCGHGSFFRAAWANHLVGFITGVLAFTPYQLWRKEHMLHHGTAGDLDRRGVGDVPTLTVKEYLAASRWDRFVYRLGRHPLIMFGLLPPIMFLFWHRLPVSKAATVAERRAVHATNLGLLVIFAAMIPLYGAGNFLLIQLSMTTIGGAIGTWLFYVQHQFEGVYWEREEEWDFVEAALKGSSFYKLPRVLQWFTGNIGYHHIHHLSSRIPNYHLERCHDAEPLFQTVPPITLLGSLRCLKYRLWDEEGGCLVGFDHLRRGR